MTASTLGAADPSRTGDRLPRLDRTCQQPRNFVGDNRARSCGLQSADCARHRPINAGFATAQRVGG